MRRIAIQIVWGSFFWSFTKCIEQIGKFDSYLCSGTWKWQNSLRKRKKKQKTKQQQINTFSQFAVFYICWSFRKSTSIIALDWKWSVGGVPHSHTHTHLEHAQNQCHLDSQLYVPNRRTWISADFIFKFSAMFFYFVDAMDHVWNFPIMRTLYWALYVAFVVLTREQ